MPMTAIGVLEAWM